MRRLPAFLLLVLAMLLMLTAVAAAAPPGACSPWPSCKAGDDDPPEDPVIADCAETQTMEVSKGRFGFECLWTPGSSSDGSVTVHPNGDVSSLVVFVRDDSPGDICLLTNTTDLDLADAPFQSVPFLLAYPSGSEFASLLDLWGPYSEPYAVALAESHAGSDYATWVGGHWCEPQDGVEGRRADTNGKPLHLLVQFRSNKASSVTITLSPAP